MPRLRRLLHPEAGRDHPQGAGPAQGGARLHQRHRLQLALPVLPGHLWHARDPWPCAGHRERVAQRAARAERMDDHRRRRLAEHRRQPPDPPAAAQRGREHPALQQRDLRPHQGPVLAHQSRGGGDAEHAHGQHRPSLQPDGPVQGRRWHVPGTRHGPRPQAAARGAHPRRCPPRRQPGGGLPELQRVQRRGLRSLHRQGLQALPYHLRGAREAARLRQRHQGHPAGLHASHGGGPGGW